MTGVFKKSYHNILKIDDLYTPLTPETSKYLGNKLERYIRF